MYTKHKAQTRPTPELYAQLVYEHEHSNQQYMAAFKALTSTCRLGTYKCVETSRLLLKGDISASFYDF